MCPTCKCKFSKIIEHLEQLVMYQDDIDTGWPIEMGLIGESDGENVPGSYIFADDVKDILDTFK